MQIFALINFGLNSAFPSFNPLGLSGGWLKDEQTPPKQNPSYGLDPDEQ
jgi:hypothetical protein